MNYYLFTPTQIEIANIILEEFDSQDNKYHTKDELERALTINPKFQRGGYSTIDIWTTARLLTSTPFFTALDKEKDFFIQPTLLGKKAFEMGGIDKYIEAEERKEEEKHSALIASTKAASDSARSAKLSTIISGVSLIVTIAIAFYTTYQSNTKQETSSEYIYQIIPEKSNSFDSAIKQDSLPVKRDTVSPNKKQSK